MGLRASFATPGNTAYGRCSATHRWLFGLQRMTDQEGQRLWTRIYSRAFPRPDRHMFMGAPPTPMPAALRRNGWGLVPVLVALCDRSWLQACCSGFLRDG